jgi:hypothetical protein
LASTETNRYSPSSNRTRRPAEALLQQHAHRAVSVHPHLGAVSHQKEKELITDLKIEKNRPEETDLKKSKIYCCVCFLLLQVTVAFTAGMEGKRG